MCPPNVARTPKASPFARSCGSFAATARSFGSVRRSPAALDGEVLRIGAPISSGPVPGDWCRFYRQERFARGSVAVGAYQRLGVTPDGSRVIFELSDDFSLANPDGILLPEQE